VHITSKLLEPVALVVNLLGGLLLHHVIELPKHHFLVRAKVNSLFSATQKLR
jgi:hypothetical protein